MAEYIYILINPSLKNILKVGRTDRTPEIRARELSAATGVPTPFVVAYESRVGDSVAAERRIHELAAEKGIRINLSREFFEIPLKEAVKIVHQVCENYPCVDEAASGPEELRDVEYFLSDGISKLSGSLGELQDYSAALRCFEKAELLGNDDASKYIAIMQFSGLGVKASAEVTLRTLLKAAERCGGQYWYYLWLFYGGNFLLTCNCNQLPLDYKKLINLQNSEKCYSKYLHENHCKLDELIKYIDLMGGPPQDEVHKNNSSAVVSQVAQYLRNQLIGVVDGSLSRDAVSIEGLENFSELFLRIFTSLKENMHYDLLSNYCAQVFGGASKKIFMQLATLNSEPRWRDAISYAKQFRS